MLPVWRNHFRSTTRPRMAVHGLEWAVVRSSLRLFMFLSGVIARGRRYRLIQSIQADRLRDCQTDRSGLGFARGDSDVVSYADPGCKSAVRRSGQSDGAGGPLEELEGMLEVTERLETPARNPPAVAHEEAVRRDRPAHDALCQNSREAVTGHGVAP